MASLGSLYYTLGIRDLTDADLQKINAKLKNLGSDLMINPKLIKSVKEILPKGLKLELDPKLKKVSNEALAKAAEGKVMRVEIMPLLSKLRKALKDATKDNPPQVEVGVQETKLRTLIERVLNKHGFMINISTVNDNYTKVVQQKLNGTRYTVKIHADAKEITQSVQASLMQVQSRYFGLKISRDILYRSIDEALGGHKFPVSVFVKTDTARNAVQTALNRAAGMSSQDIINHNRLMKAEAAAAVAELNRVKAAQLGAADAANTHSEAAKGVGSSLFSLSGPIGEVKSMLVDLWSIHAAKEFLSQVIEIGGELEHQKIAMDTIFGDKGKTVELFGEIKGLARQSPFGVMELTKSVKALSAYGVQYNEIYDTAKRLADISAATSVDINRLILAFGKTKSRGFLDGLEAKQFAYANIPIYEMVRKKLEELEGQAVTTQQVMERMRKREIGFDIVKDVLWDMTDPGGKFYNMQEALAGSVKTSWKLVRDNIELMFGEIAESSIGSGLKSIAEILQGLTRNWKTLGSVIAWSVGAIMTYKVAVWAVNTAMGKNMMTTLSSVAAKRSLAEANRVATLTYRSLTEAERNELMAARAAHNLTGIRALSRKKLNSAELAGLYATKAITKEQLLQLVALKRVTVAQADRLLITKNLSRAEREALRLEIARAAAAKKSTVIWGQFRGVLMKVGAALKSFAMASLPLAALSAVVGLFSKFSEQKEKAEEIGNALSTKAAEGARNLTNALKELNGEFSNMDDTQLRRNIEKLEELIKDYGILSDKVLFYSNVDDKGVMRSSEDRAQYLYEQVKTLEAAYAKFNDWKIGDMVARSVDTSSFWKLDWDGLNDDLDDYVTDVRNAQKELSDYLRDHKDEAKLVVEFATKESPEFKALTEGMGVEQAMSALTSDLDLLTGVYNKLDAIKSSTGRIILDGQDINEFVDLSEQFLDNWTNTDVSHSLAEAKKEFEKAMASLRTELLAKDSTFFDVDKWTQEKSHMMGMAFQKIFEKLEGLDYQYQKPFVDMWNNYFNTSFDPDFIEGQIQRQFISLIPELGEDLANAIRLGKSLEDAEEDKVKAVFNKAVSEVKRAWPGRAAEIQGIIDSKPVYAAIRSKIDITSGLDDWQKELSDSFGNNREIIAKIKGEVDTQSTLKAIAELKKSTKQALDKFALSFNITPNFGALEKRSTDGPLTAFEKQQIEEYNKLVDRWNTIVEGEKTTGIDLDKWQKTDRANQEDKIAKSLKQEFKDIKDAYAMYKEWAKIEGSEPAFKRVGDSGLFATLDPDKVPKTVDEYLALIDDIENRLKEAGIKGKSQRESLFNDIVKERLGINKDTVKEQLNLALDEVTKEAERQIADWNLFEKIRKATGNKDYAMSIAFGMNATAETDYPKMIEAQLDKQARVYEDALSKKTKGTENEYSIKGYTYTSLRSLYDKKQAHDATDADVLAWKAVPEDIRKAWEKANGDIIKYFDQQKESITDILTEYQSLQDKLAKIDSDREDKIKTVQASDLSDADKAKYIQRINVEADYQKFTQSNEYLQFFSGVYSLTMEKAQQIGDKIRLHLDQRLQAGKLSAEEYYKEIERINQQLTKLRNVKSDAMTFMTSGIKGVQNKKLEKADSDILAQTAKVQEAEEKLQKAKAEGNIGEIAAAEESLRLAKQGLNTYESVRNAIVKDQAKWQNIADVTNIAANIAGGISDAFNTIKDMAAAFGADTDSGAWNTIGAVIDTMTAVTSGVQKVVQSVMSGDIGGIISGTVDTLLTPFTIWAKLHDAALQKEIELSEKEYEARQRLIDVIDRQIDRYLGHAADEIPQEAYRDKKEYERYAGRTETLSQLLRRIRFGDTTAQRLQNTQKQVFDDGGGLYAYKKVQMQAQLAELEKQRRLELEKKDVDDDKVKELDAQIAELRDQIRYFAEDMAKELYEIDLKSWAKDLGNEIFNAWKKGEDGAEAFKKKVADIMGNVMSNILRLEILEPMMKDIRTMLFGSDGNGGMMGKDYKLDVGDVKKIADKLMEGSEQVEAYNRVMDEVDDYMKRNYGVSMKDTQEKSGLSAGIQGVTENTADLLASYINAIRADVSMNRQNWDNLLNIALPQMNIIAESQLRVQRQIAENTMRNAVAAEAVAKSNDEINRLLSRVTQGASVFYVK